MGLSPVASRRATLPYGAVMATGGASDLADATGLHLVGTSLMWLAVAEAIAIPLLGIARRGSMARAAGDLVHAGEPARRFGDFTVPLGLAVVGGDFARGTGPSVAVGFVAVLCGWLATTLLTVTVVVPVVRSRPALGAVNGAWFLAPAALLGDAIGTVLLLPHLPLATRTPLAWLALAACGLGVAGYLVVIGLSAIRVARDGLAGAPRVTWWISAGCGGLAAAAVGEVQRSTSLGAQARPYAGAALVLWLIASALLVPILTGSVTHLLRLRRPAASPPWPPTFSTAVYAAGTLHAGRLTHVETVRCLGHVAGLVTVGLWIVTAGLWVAVSRR